VGKIDPDGVCQGRDILRGTAEVTEKEKRKSGPDRPPILKGKRNHIPGETAEKKKERKLERDPTWNRGKWPGKYGRSGKVKQEWKREKRTGWHTKRGREGSWQQKKRWRGKLLQTGSMGRRRPAECWVEFEIKRPIALKKIILTKGETEGALTGEPQKEPEGGIEKKRW